MKIKLVFISFLLTFGLLCGYAQEPKKFDVKEFKQEKREFIIKEVGLSNEEAARFFPLSEELMDKKYELNRAIRIEGRALKAKQNATAAEYDVLMNKILDMHIREAELEKEYYSKFKEVLSPEKLYKYHRAEKKFMQTTVQNKNRNQSRHQHGKK